MRMELNGIDYDIIGDIHGHADALEQLLQKLGYRRKFGVYSHPEKRKVVFVGDFIDRGPRIRETLHLVRDMIESGNALSVMGNHEFNAISFHTPHTEKGGFFRDHTIKEIKQHIETLDQFKNYDSEWSGFLEWFKSLPLYLEFDQFRVVHACWDNHHIKFFKEHFHGFTTEFLSRGNNKKDVEGYYAAVNETMKGKEYRLPAGVLFTDKDGTKRSECRIRWWSDPLSRKTLKDVVMECPEELANIEIKKQDDFHLYADKKPVFFGHYWLKGKPNLENTQAICLDYSVAKGGVLVACRLTKDKDKLQTTFVI